MSESVTVTPENFNGNVRVFLQALTVTANVSRSAELSGFDRANAYKLRRSNPDFLAAWEAALELGVDALEDEAMRRAKDGVQKYVVSQGKIVIDPEDPSGKKPLIEHVYSDALAMFLLKARRPDRYKERTTVDMNVTTDLAVRMEQARKRIDG